MILLLKNTVKTSLLAFRVAFICSVSSEVENVVAQLHHGPDEQNPKRDANRTHQDVH